MTPASSAPRTTISIRTESAAKFKANASSSTFNKVFVRSAMRATKSSMVNAKRPISTLFPTSDAPSGSLVFVLNAQKDGILMPKKFVFPSAISAQLGTMLLEPASPVTTDPLFKMDNVSSTLILQLFPKATSSARPGLEKNVLPAQIEALPTKMASALLSAPAAIPSIRLLVIVYPASRVMTSKMENVFTLPQILLSLLILAAAPGIGKSKSVLLAQRDGPSMLTKFACQSLTNALLMVPMVAALLAIKVMTSPMENASSLFPTP